MIDAVELARRAVELTRPYCDRCQCEITLNVPATNEPLRFRGDEQRLLQVLGNFISNAAKFTHAGDTIEVAVEPEADTIAIAVTDHGPGVPLERQKFLFSASNVCTATTAASCRAPV